MRITTQMLNETASKSGLPINNASLLNSSTDADGVNNSLLDALSKSSEKELLADSKTNISYETLEKAADELKKYAETLLQDGENSIFGQAEESGDYQKVYDSIKGFFESYNNTLEALKGASGMMNEFYRQMLTETSEGIKESLGNVGITFDDKGTAVVDMEKLKQADPKTLEALFGSQSEFVGKVKVLSGRISDNAEENAKSLSSTYASNGNLYTAVTGSKYDVWG